MWKVFDRAESMLAIIFLSGTVLAVFAGALARAIGSPIPMAPEIAQLMLIWTVMFGADLVMRRGEHIRVSALPDALSPRNRRVLNFVCFVTIVAFLAYVAWLGVQLAMSNWAREMGTSGLSYGWVTLALPVGAVLMILSLLRRFSEHGLLYTLEPEAAPQEYPL